MASISIYHDEKTLKNLRTRETKRKKGFSKFTKKHFKKLDSRRFYKLGLYGRVLLLTTQNIKYGLNIAETIIPMTFFLLSILGEFIYRKFGFKELLRITINNKPRKF